MKAMTKYAVKNPLVNPELYETQETQAALLSKAASGHKKLVKILLNFIDESLVSQHTGSEATSLQLLRGIQQKHIFTSYGKP